MCNKIYREVLGLVVAETEISADLIMSKSRIADVVDARQLVVWFCFKRGLYPRTIASYLCISRQAVCQKIQTIEDRRKNKAFQYTFERVQEKCKQLEANEKITSSIA